MASQHSSGIWITLVHIKFSASDAETRKITISMHGSSAEEKIMWREKTGLTERSTEDNGIMEWTSSTDKLRQEMQILTEEFRMMDLKNIAFEDKMDAQTHNLVKDDQAMDWASMDDHFDTQTRKRKALPSNEPPTKKRRVHYKEPSSSATIDEPMIWTPTDDLTLGVQDMPKRDRKMNLLKQGGAVIYGRAD